MEGVILDFNPSNGTGVLRCGQGQRYGYSLAEWQHEEAPRPGDRVEFDAIGDQAHNVSRLDQPVAVVTAPAASPAATPTAAATPYAPPASAPQVVPTQSALAIVSLIAGIVGLFFFGSLVAVICGHVARSNIRASNGTQTGDGMALAGLILGYIGLAMALLWIIVVVVIAVLAGTA